MKRFWCWLTQTHDPRRLPIGGFRCSRCGKTGADYEEFGLAGGRVEGGKTDRRVIRSVCLAGEDER